jgi:hypothetical protein
MLSASASEQTTGCSRAMQCLVGVPWCETPHFQSRVLISLSSSFPTFHQDKIFQNEHPFLRKFRFIPPPSNTSCPALGIQLRRPQGGRPRSLTVMLLRLIVLQLRQGKLHDLRRFALSVAQTIEPRPPLRRIVRYRESAEDEALDHGKLSAGRRRIAQANVVKCVGANTSQHDAMVRARPSTITRQRLAAARSRLSTWRSHRSLSVGSTRSAAMTSI